MAHYGLSSPAKRDLARLHADGIRQFGEIHANAYFNSLIEQFDYLTAQPQSFRLRSMMGDGLRVCPHGAHVIIYEERPDGNVLILRICHGREDWSHQE